MSNFNDILDLSYNDTDGFDDFDYMESRDYEAEVQELQESFDANFNKYFNKRSRKLNEDVEEEDDYEVVNPLLEMKKLKMPIKKSKTESMRRFRETLSSQSERLRRMEKLLTKN